MPKPQYYLRMNIDGRWHFLHKVIYRPERPVWVDESELGKLAPKLYSTLAIARNALDLHVSARATKADVKIWSTSN